MASRAFPSLSEFSIDSLFKDILCSISTVSNETDRAKVVLEVRQKLHEYLVGPKYYSAVRETLVGKFLKKDFNDDDWHKLHILLDCVLDESITEFPKTSFYVSLGDTLSGFSSLPAINILESVTTLCPNLQDFFSFHPVLLCPIFVEQEARFAQLFSNLGNLTDLTLKWCRPLASDSIQFFTHFGESCPQLKSLTLGHGFIFGAEQLLFLTLGKNAEALSPLVKQQIFECGMHRVQFDDQYTTAITKSLEDLRSNQNQFTCVNHCVPSQAFLLRHYPKLKTVQILIHLIYKTCLPKALGLLQDALDNANHQLIQNRFVAAVNNFNDPPRLKWTLNAPPPCRLN